jgi:hypothetical protein
MPPRLTVHGIGRDVSDRADDENLHLHLPFGGASVRRCVRGRSCRARIIDVDEREPAVRPQVISPKAGATAFPPEVHETVRGVVQGTVPAVDGQGLLLHPQELLRPLPCNGHEVGR